MAGEGRLRDSVAMELSALGIQTRLESFGSSEIDLCIYCQDEHDQASQRQANREFVENAIPYLPVSTDRHIITTGPLIIPGATACAECAYHRAQMRSGPDAPVEQTPKGTHSGFAIRLAALFAVEEALRFVYGACYDLHTATQTRHSVITGRRKQSTILKIPRCPVCGPEKIRRRPLTDTFDRSIAAISVSAE